MLAAETVLEVRRLIDEGELSQRAIARRVKVSRGSVGAIANGRRGLHGRGSRETRVLGEEFAAIPSRCPSCGGLVYEPCLLCRTREYRRLLQEHCTGRQPDEPRRPPRRAA